MLVLGRKKQEVIHIGDDITVTVVRFGRDRVHLGIEAPPDVPIVRHELIEATEREDAEYNVQFHEFHSRQMPEEQG